MFNRRRMLMNKGNSESGITETILVSDYQYDGSGKVTIGNYPFDMDTQTMIIEFEDVSLEYPKAKLIQFGYATGDIGSSSKTYNVYYQTDDDPYKVVFANRGSDWSISYGNTYGSKYIVGQVVPPTIKLVFGLNGLSVNGYLQNTDGWTWLSWGSGIESYRALYDNKIIAIGWRNEDYGRMPVHIKKISVLDACLTLDEICDYARV